MKTKAIFFLALLLLGVPALAQEFGTASGIVTLGDNPVGAVTVTFTPQANNGHVRTAQTGRDGRYSLVQLLATTYIASTIVQDRRMVVENVRVVADHNVEVSFHFEPNGGDNPVGGVAGVVTDPDGAALSRVEVVISRDNFRQATQTNDHGQYVFENVPVGEFTQTAAKQGYQAYQGRVAVRENEVTEVNIELGPNQQDEVGGVAGVVTDPDGATIANVEVAISRNENNQNAYRQVTRTGEDGHYAFDNVPVGEFHQVAAKQGYQAYQGRVAVQADQVTEVNIVLHPVENHDQVGAVGGMVSDTDGNPLAAAVVTLTGANNNNRYATHTNERGQYSFANVPVGVYTGRASKAGFNPQEVRVEVQANAAVEVNFVLEPQGNNGGDEVGRIIGAVVTPDGAPIARADALISREGDHDAFHFLAHTGERGMFEMNNIPVGVFALNVSKNGYVAYNGEVEVVADQATNVAITLQPEDHHNDVFGSVGGVVTDTAGQAIELALVMITGADNNNDPHNGGRQYSAQTNGEGRYLIENVPVGAYSARASKLNYRAAEGRVAVEEGAVAEANFVLTPEGDGGGHHGGGDDQPGDTLIAHGTAIVIAGDVADIYLLDADNDGAADYILYFGAPDFDPGNGAARPRDGEEIDIVGLLIGNMQPPLVVVLEINGLAWHNGDRGNGGEPGGGNGWEGGDNLQIIQAEGRVAVPNPHNPWYHRYFFDTTDDGRPEYRLLFGEDDYDPGNGAVRPADGDFVNVTGGEFQPQEGLPVIVVYEINGQFWRDPADTARLFWQVPESVNDQPALPVTAALIKAYPNPFNPTAVISVTLPNSMRARVSVVDLTGREVALISDGILPSGESKLTLDGSRLDAGTYFLRVETPAGGMVSRVTLLK